MHTHLKRGFSAAHHALIRCMPLIYALFFTNVVLIGHAQRVKVQYTLPGNNVFPEGIAYDVATGNFYVGSTAHGTIYRGNIQAEGGDLEVFLKAGRDQRTAVTGMKVDAQGRLFIAGRNTGRAFVYDTASGDLIKALTTPPAPNTLLNDVTVTKDAAYFTDSFRPVIFRAALTPDVGELEVWLELENTPITYQRGFNLNGIAASKNGAYLLSVQFNTGELYRIDTETREIIQVNLGGAKLVTGDGLWLEGQTLFVVRENPAEIVVITLLEDFSSGTVTSRITDPSLDLPTTLAKAGKRLLVVNSQLDTASPELPFTVSSLLP